MSFGTEANPIELFSSGEESDFSDVEDRVTTPPSGTKEYPILLMSDSESESTPAPVSPLGSSKRPITLDDDDSGSDEEPPKKKRTPSPPHPARINLSLAIPANIQPPPPLLRHHLAATAANPEGNFVAPTIDKSTRLTALLRACPSLPVAPVLLPAHEQIHHELRLVRNRAATENGEFLAWRSFAHPSRSTRECMVQSGLDLEDLWDEADGEENGLPAWKQANTSEWALRGEAPMERRTPSLSREPSAFGEVEEDEEDWVVVEGENEEEVVVVEDDNDDDDAVVRKVNRRDEGYEGDVEY
jgi:hypothetical protein